MGSVSAGDRAGDGLAVVCARADRIRADLGNSALVDGVLGAARAGQGVEEALAALHEAILATGDALGVHGQATLRDVPGVSVAGIARVPTDAVHVCPTGSCSRYRWADEPGPVPVCEVSGRPLRRERLP
ncbi:MULTISPECIES: hypothetical protein [Streptomyces]|uniref:Uncharacterized protein n=1 Tax=Streptomyces cadmiisoli TaxID=2184053 RepID=A0A2Z4IUF9_9ACTN|nr:MULTISPECIES: hypothetical protein [Streptomyces]AWW36384.1 hypothetical protein DN051_06820 [Streptomyces cadmiisoli]